MSNKKERITEAYNYLRNNGLAHTQKDIADKMGASESNVSSALRGNEKVLTNKFIKRFVLAFGGIFDAEYLISGEGTMLKANAQNIIATDHSNAAGHDVNVMAGDEQSKEKIKLLQQLLDEKERTIQEKERTIQILLAQQQKEKQ